MKQEFLKELGLTDEQIQSVLNKHNEKIEAEKKKTNDMANKLEASETELSTVKEELNSANTNIKELEVKYETDTKALKDSLESKETEYCAKEYLSKIPFTSNMAREAALKKFIEKGLKRENGVFLGADDFIKEIQERDPGAIKSESNEKIPTIVRPTNGGAGGGIKASLSEMMKMANIIK